ncbi:MAG: serine/threonine dehydratase [Melioribacteraceae bacterium]|nr:serine/threonine dehydratase [Melioribacteraceae bacterium]
MLGINDIIAAKNRIDKYVHKTPILYSRTLNLLLGHDIYFKAEGLQKIGAFKIRGGINAVSWLLENNIKPQKLVTNSSGNHAQALALASKVFNIPSTIFMPENVSSVKARATAAYGADIVFCQNRIVADEKVEEASKAEGTYWIPPFNHEQVICGQGTSAYEALNDLNDINALFAPCGGGGLLSGSFICASSLSPSIKVIGVEPKLANDAFRSLKAGSIVKLTEPPDTVADGARTMSVGNLTFEYLKKLDDFFEAEEEEIIYWTQWLTHLLKIQIEPTSAMVMAGVTKWLRNQKSKKRLLVILSGANIDINTMNKIWQKDHLQNIPTLN